MFARRAVCKLFAIDRWPIRTEREPGGSYICQEHWSKSGVVCKPKRFALQAATNSVPQPLTFMERLDTLLTDLLHWFGLIMPVVFGVSLLWGVVVVWLQLYLRLW